MPVLRLLWRFRLFALIVAIGLTADLASKAIIFDKLGVTDDEIHAAYDRYEAEIAAADEYQEALDSDKAKDEAGNPIRPVVEPRLEIRSAMASHAVWTDTITQPDGTTERVNRITFRATLNPGAFGGFLGGNVAILLGLSVISLGIVAYLLMRSSLPRYQVVGGLIIAGAVGNIYDRIVYHCVRDFFQFRWPETGVPWMNPWNVFNYADALIVGGILALLVIEFVFPLPETKGSQPDTADAPDSADDSETGEPAAVPTNA